MTFPRLEREIEARLWMLFTVGMPLDHEKAVDALYNEVVACFEENGIDPIFGTYINYYQLLMNAKARFGNRQE